MHGLRQQIKVVVSKRESLKQEMSAWYEANPSKPFKKLSELSTVDGELSALDTQYKKLWDSYNA